MRGERKAVSALRNCLKHVDRESFGLWRAGKLKRLWIVKLMQARLAGLNRLFEAGGSVRGYRR
jgi:hypothetical protein